MSLQINTFNSTTVTVKPKPVTRVFSVSPAIYGTTLWDIDQQSQLNVSSSGIWTLTPNIDFTASVKMWGAGGSGRSGSYEYSGEVGCGGAGGYTYGTMSFVKDQTYILVVGQGGYLTGSANGTRTIGGGGYGRRATGVMNGIGGGLSGIFQGSYSHANSVMVAGGGAAAGHAAYNGGNYFAPAGGGLSGQGTTERFQAGQSGTQLAGGAPAAYNDGTSGSMLLGGLGSIGGTFRYGIPGAGSGYYGGGGGNAGHAGAGSGFISGTVVGGATVAGTNITPANYSDPLRGNSGQGGSGSSGNDGRVIIS